MAEGPGNGNAPAGPPSPVEPSAFSLDRWRMFLRKEFLACKTAAEREIVLTMLLETMTISANASVANEKAPRNALDAKDMESYGQGWVRPQRRQNRYRLCERCGTSARYWRYLWCRECIRTFSRIRMKERKCH